MQFSETVRRAAEANESRIVLALDLEGRDADRLVVKSKDILRKVGKYICALKLNRQLVMSLGFGDKVQSIVNLAHELSLPTIMDAKLNDVGHTNEFIAKSYFDMGFDAIIASPVAGWENGLDTVFAEANSRGRGILLLTYMSNPGAEEFYALSVAHGREQATPIFELLAELGTKWKADGLIVGATRLEVISRVRQLTGPGMAIYSPGVGAQGGDAKKALDAGSTYLIVGRAIFNASDPERSAMEFRRAVV